MTTTSFNTNTKAIDELASKRKKMEAVLSLEAAKRYEHWIKKVTDQEEVWSLWQEGGWALAGGYTGGQCVPVWPHSRYAALCAEGVWAGYQPKAIVLDPWLDQQHSRQRRPRPDRAN